MHIFISLFIRKPYQIRMPTVLIIIYAYIS
nr:MAG TPA: hypothetical protein [Caudoviricetes sp.]